MTKKQAKKAKPKSQRKVAPVRELSDQELGQVGGGTSIYMKIEGVPGESQPSTGGSLLESTLTTYNPPRRF